MTKVEELRITVHEHRADLVLLSESNVDTSNAEEIHYRNSKFPEYRFDLTVCRTYSL